MSYGRPTFDMNKEEGALAVVKFDPRYDDRKRYGFVIPNTSIFGAPKDVIKRMRIYMENQRMDKQIKGINEAISCLRYLFE